MGIKVEGLQATIKRFKGIPTARQFAETIAAKGNDIAKELYSGHSGVTVYNTNQGNTSTINAEGKGVKYFEYGTGREGAGTYKGNLPTEPITFTSGGESHTTAGWEYYYDNPKTKVTKNGKDGWLLNKTFVTGGIAEAQMWQTSKELKEKIPEIVAQAIVNKQGGA